MCESTGKVISNVPVVSVEDISVIRGAGKSHEKRSVKSKLVESILSLFYEITLQLRLILGMEWWRKNQYDKENNSENIDYS